MRPGSRIYGRFGTRYDPIGNVTNVAQEWWWKTFLWFLYMAVISINYREMRHGLILNTSWLCEPNKPKSFDLGSSKKLCHCNMLHYCWSRSCLWFFFQKLQLPNHKWAASKNLFLYIESNMSSVKKSVKSSACPIEY